MCMHSGPNGMGLGAAIAKGLTSRFSQNQADLRTINPELMSRLNATAAKPGSAQPMFGMTGAQPNGSPLPVRGGLMGNIGQGLGGAFAAASSAAPGGRIVR